MSRRTYWRALARARRLADDERRVDEHAEERRELQRRYGRIAEVAIGALASGPLRERLVLGVLGASEHA